MKTTERILVAVDESDASEKAVSYLGRVLSGSACELRLFHVVEPIGPTWAAVHGNLTTESEAPPGAPETLLIEEAKERSRPVLERMLGILTRAGLDRDRIEPSWFTASREDTLEFEILTLAREQGYRTVVAGRTALPWYRELFHRHLGESLVKKGEGLSVWVVE
jgi:nucleotide-binding universal stress UspA family protein